MIGTPNSTMPGQSRILFKESFDDKGYTNIASLTEARMTSPDTLNPAITHLMGKDSKKFPLLYLTEGQKGGTDWKEISSIEYDWPVMGRMRHTDMVAGHDYAPTDEPGKTGPINVVFKTAWLKMQHNIVSPNGYTCRILYKPTKVSNGYLYVLDMIKRSESDFIPVSEFDTNTLWAMSGGANVAESYSVGNESNKQFPGKVKNQIGVLRKSFEIAGNISNQTVIYQLALKSGVTNYWLPFEEYQHETQFKQAVEESLWDSTYNRDDNGRILTIDPDTQLPIPYGAGLREQIPNQDTYSELTLRKLSNTVGDIMYGATDTDNMNIVLFTGTGGKEEFSNAIMNGIQGNSSGWSLYNGALNNTITGGPRGLVFGAYFTQFRHVDGHIITVADLPILDHGARAQNAPRHPISGKPLTSYEMHFVDMSTYDGVKNVQLVCQRGRSLIRGIEQGMSLYKGGNYADYSGNAMDIKLATSQDKTSIHYLKTCGIALRRNTTSFSLYCDIS